MAPATIERDSVATYRAPSVETVRQRVARATEGAAPNSPAKLLGLNKSPNSANAETTAPPIRNRRKISFMANSVSFHSRLHELMRLGRAFSAQHAVFLARQLVIVNKEFFQFAAKLLAQIVNGLYVGPSMGVFLNRYNSVVPLLLFLLSVPLLALYYPNEPTLQYASGESWLIH